MADTDVRTITQHPPEADAQGLLAPRWVGQTTARPGVDWRGRTVEHVIDDMNHALGPQADTKYVIRE